MLTLSVSASRKNQPSKKPFKDTHITHSKSIACMFASRDVIKKKSVRALTLLSTKVSVN